MTKLWVLSVKESFHFVEIVPFFFIIVSLIHSHVICPCGNCSCPKGEGGCILFHHKVRKEVSIRPTSLLNSIENVKWKTLGDLEDIILN